MSTATDSRRRRSQIPPELVALLGVRRTAILRRLIKQTGLPWEPLVDLGLEMLDIASRKLVSSPVRREAVSLGAARWQKVSPEKRSEVMSKLVQARWEKHRKEQATVGGPKEE